MTPEELYVNGVKEKLGIYYAAWLPQFEFHLGDIGVLDGKLFRRVSNLQNQGIAFQELPGSKPSTLDIMSDKGVSITFKAAGQTNSNVPNVPTAEAGVALDFNTEGAFLIQATDVYEPSIADIAKLQNDVIAAYKKGAWHLEWAIIVSLVHTANAIVLVSQSSNAKVELSASGTAGTGAFKLVDANIKLAVQHQSGNMVRVDRAVNVTPLFQLAGIHRRWFRPELRLEKALTSPIAELTPELVRSNPEVESSLYLDLIDSGRPR